MKIEKLKFIAIIVIFALIGSIACASNGTILFLDSNVHARCDASLYRRNLYDQATTKYGSAIEKFYQQKEAIEGDLRRGVITKIEAGVRLTRAGDILHEAEMECQASQKGLDTVITRIEELISIAVKRIAARHNATAVSILEYNFYINPDNDITAEVLADINQDFKENHMLYFK